jgi:hypothetical protein
MYDYKDLHTESNKELKKSIDDIAYQFNFPINAGITFHIGLYKSEKEKNFIFIVCFDHCTKLLFVIKMSTSINCCLECWGGMIFINSIKDLRNKKLRISMTNKYSSE